MNGDIDAYHDPMEMLHDATQYLERVRQTLIEANRFEDILQVRSAANSTANTPASAATASTFKMSGRKSSYGPSTRPANC